MKIKPFPISVQKVNIPTSIQSKSNLTVNNKPQLNKSKNMYKNYKIIIPLQKYDIK